MLDDDIRSIQPTGLALVILTVSVICLTLASVAVGLRSYIRLSEHTFGLDDSLIVVGLLIYFIDVVLACYGTSVGLGTRNADLNAWLIVEGLKYLMLWMMIYIISLAAIKSSICVTLYRIASATTSYRIAVFVLLGLTITTMLVTLIGVLLLCKPVSGTWTGEGECAGQSTMIALSYTSTASTILTDLSLAILPGVMIWKTAMDPAHKISIFVLLSFASIASITTMIRAPYIQHYWTPLEDLDYWTGYIVLLSNIEGAIGCIASSIPSLRRINRKAKGAESSGSSAPTPGQRSLITFGSLPVRNHSSTKMFRNPTDQGVSFASVQARNWSRLQDGTETTSSQDEDEAGRFDGIRAEYTYEVELTRLASKGKA